MIHTFRSIFLFVTSTFVLSSCYHSAPTTYLYDLQFIEIYGRAYEQTADNGNARIVVSPDFQGRVMTSSATGINGFSNGWINKRFISRDIILDKENPYGGENYTWIGPNDGEYSLFHKFNKEGDTAFQVPADLDQFPFLMEFVSDTSMLLTKKLNATNLKGSTFNAKLSRFITLHSKSTINHLLHLNGDTAQLSIVGYTVKSTLTNIGMNNWDESTGLMSLQNVNQFNGEGTSTIFLQNHNAIPLDSISVFSNMDSSNVKFNNQVLALRADGIHTYTLKLPIFASSSLIGIYTPKLQRLTIIQNNNAESKRQERLEIKNGAPLEGTSIASYYQLRADSGSKPLKPNESIKQSQSIYHIYGDSTTMNSVLVKVFDLELAEIPAFQ